ncbi:endoglucanase 3 [Hordeum vulgare]|nr:endoglucanase 3 [Hordeum vulgare]
MEEMASLEGEERAFQEKRVKDLLDAANQQHARLDPSQAQSESPGPNSGGRRNPSAIQYYIDGCRDGTLLKHKLMCTEPTSLAVLMAKADKYATADSAMRVKVTASDKVVPTLASPKPDGDNRGGQNNYKCKADQMDPRSNSKLVASMEGETSAPQADPPRKRPNRSNTNWLPKQSFEQLLDAPFKIHSGAQPSSHTLRQCSFARRLSQGDGLPAPPGNNNKCNKKSMLHVSFY